MPLPFTPELTDAIEALYTAFQGYALPSDLRPCPCCHSVDAERPLRSTPLRKLSSKDLKEYAMDAMLTWGDSHLFRYFLPRIFEIVVSADRFSFADREIVFSKLYEGEWRYWPEAEQKAVQRFLLALWHAALQNQPTDEVYAADSLEAWLCALAHPGGDLSSYLDEWLDSPLPTAVWNLAVAITRTGLAQGRPRINAYWRGHEDQLEQVSEWLRSNAVRNRLEAAAEQYADQPFAEELTAAARMVG
jgi:hypothetical protein